MNNRNKEKQLLFAGISAFCGIVIAFIAILNFVGVKEETKKIDKKQITHNIDQINKRITEKEKSLNDITSKTVYNKFKVLKNEEIYFDEKTRFEFYTKEISGYNNFLGKTDGVLSQYILPNGEIGKMWRRRKGSVIEYVSSGKNFIAKIYDIDYELETVTLEIKEIMK